MTWDQAEKRSDEGAGGGKYVRLANDGDTVIGAFVGDPFIRDLVWNQAKGQYEDLTEEHQAKGEKGSPKFSLNFYVLDEKAMKIIDLNNDTFKSVLDCKKKYGLDKWFFEIKRNGKAGDTKTKYGVLPEREQTNEEKKMILGTEKHDLGKEKASGGGAQAPASTMAAAEKKAAPAAAAAAPAGAIPELISVDDAKAMIERLRPMAKEKVQAFLEKFGVKQLKLLPAGQKPAALTMLDELEGKVAAPAAAAAEEDPFAT